MPLPLEVLVPPRRERLGSEHEARRAAAPLAGRAHGIGEEPGQDVARVSVVGL